MIPRDGKHALYKSYDVLDAVIDRGESSDLANTLSCSIGKVRSWCREPMADDNNATGRFNPLDYIKVVIFQVIESDGFPNRAFPIGNYIAHLLGGVFVPTPPVNHSDSDFLGHVSRVLKETGEAIEECRSSYFDGKAPLQFTTYERPNCEREIDEAIVALCQLKRYVQTGGRQ